MPGDGIQTPRRGDILRIRDQRWMVSEAVRYTDAIVLNVCGCDRSNRGQRTEYLLPFEPFERLPSVSATQVVSRRRWRHRVRELLAGAVPAMDALQAAATADISIWPYQLEPALAVTGGHASRILIADEVGLGKTVQAGLIVAEALARRNDAHVLVLCPAGLRGQWHEELTTRFRLSPVVLDSTSLRQFAPVNDANPWAVYPLVIASTDYIKRPEAIRALESLIWDVVVVDEAHAIAGWSDRHVAAALLAERARCLVLLSATPHSGDELAFSRLAAIGDLEREFPLLVFRRTRADAEIPSRRRTHWLKVTLSQAERDMHDALASYARAVWQRSAATAAARLAMMILTKRACSSPSSLVSSLERRLSLLGDDAEYGAQLPLPLDPNTADDDEPGASLSACGFEDVGDERRVLERILALAREATSSETKLKLLARFLRRCTEQVIVFTEYRDTLKTVARVLDGVDTCQLHGGLTASERHDVLSQFVSGERRVLLATDAASEGLNLQHRCRIVIHLELPWTPMRIEQRVGRVDRIGQTRTVHQLQLVAAQSVEESRILSLLHRQSRASRVLEAISSRAFDERVIAACVLGDTVLTESEPATGVVLPSGLLAVDLRSRARAEAERLSLSRRLMQTPADAGSGGPISGAVATAVRRARSPRSWLALLLEYLDADDQLVFKTIVGCAWRASGSVGTASELRKTVDESFRDVYRSIADHHIHTVSAVLTLREAWLRLALRRERAVARAAEQRYARIAAQLLQRGLFDYRSDREANGQRELLQQALARCQERLSELHRWESIKAGAIRPAFALITW